MSVRDLNFYRRAFGIAVGLHALLILFFMVSPSAPSGAVVAQVSVPVQAIAVDQKQVMAEVSHIKAQERRKKIQQQHLRHQAIAAKRARITEQKRLTHLRKHMHSLQQHALAQEKRARKKLATLQKQRAQEEKQLKDLQKKKQLLAKANTKKHMQKHTQIATIKKQKASLHAQHEGAAKRHQWLQWRSQIAHYKLLIVQAIGQQWIVPSGVDRNLSCQFQITLASNGQVLEVHLLKSSGDLVLDRSAQTAIYKASPLPVPHDLKLLNLFKTLRLTVRPEEVKRVV